jgi:hypothetical protein
MLKMGIGMKPITSKTILIANVLYRIRIYYLIQNSYLQIFFVVAFNNLTKNTLFR